MALRIAFEGRTILVTISIGAASSAPGQLGPEDLLRRADDALYRAKGAGRNRVCVDAPMLLAARGAA